MSSRQVSFDSMDALSEKTLLSEKSSYEEKITSFPGDPDADIEPLTPPQKTRRSTRELLIDLFWVSTNTVATILVVFANKITFSEPQLGKCQIMTAAWHFFITTVVLLIATSSPLNAFERIRLPLADVAPIACFFVGFLVLGNASLALNSVPFYQLSKTMTMPTVVFFSYLLWNKKVSGPILSTIIMITAGVLLSSYGAATASSLGTVVAIAAFSVTALYQLWIAKKINELGVQPAQLLLNQAPAAVVLLLCIMPFVDTTPDFATVDPKALAALFVSGFLAAAINLSQFLIIGRTSALTFNIIGIGKNTVILVAGWMLHGTALGWQDLVGALLALGGSSAYSYLMICS